MAEAIEMDNLDPIEETPPENEEEETNLIDNDNPLDTSIPVPTGFNPDIGVVLDVRRDVGVMRRAFVHDKKNFLKEALKVNLNKGNGPNSAILHYNLELTRGQRTGKNNGAKFKGVKIIMLKNNEYEYSSNTKARSAINEFKELLGRTRAEHARTKEGKTEKKLEEEGIGNPPVELIESVQENTLDHIQERIDELSPASSTLSLTHSELREMPGGIHIEEQEGQTPEQQITLLEVAEKPHWEQRAKEAEDQGKNKRAQVLGNVVDTIQLKADYIRLRLCPHVSGYFLKRRFFLRF